MKPVVIPVTLVSGEAFALVNPTTGKWGQRSSGNAVFAYSFAKATELAAKVTGYSDNPPVGFLRFGHGTSKATPVAVPTVTPAAPAPKAEERKPRTVKQAAAWLRVCENNLSRCEAGEIGGDVEKFKKGVETARQTLAAAQAAEAK